MARRRMGGDAPALPGSGQAGGGSTLDRLAASIDGAPVEARLRDVDAVADGAVPRPADGLWHGLSDVKLAGAPGDRASFRRFAAHEPVPERTSFVRFREALLERGFDVALFDEVTGPLGAEAVRVETGTRWTRP